MADARQKTAIALGVATGLLFWGVIAREWFTGPGGNVGLAGVELCTPFCKLKLWTDLKAPGEVTALGLIALVFGIKSVALSAHAFAMVLKREPARIKRNWLLVSAAVTVVTAAGFLVRMLSEPFSLSYPGFFAIVGGIGVLAIVYKIKP